MNNSTERVVRGLHKRHNPGSKALVNSLLQDIELLEDRLRQAGQEPPKSQNPLLKRRSLQPFRSQRDPDKSKPDGTERDPVGSPDTRNNMMANNNSELDTSAPAQNIINTSSLHDRPEPNENNVISFAQSRPDHNRADSNSTDSSTRPLGAHPRATALRHSLFSPVQIAFDRSTGRVQYFCPSNCFKRYFRDHVRPHSGIAESRHLEKHSHRILADVPVHIQDYLMGLFWSRYNETFHVIDRKTFYEDFKTGESTSYSGFLHISCLAMGFLFAEKKNHAMRQVTLPNNTSVFYREVKYLLDGELEEPRGLTTIHAMLVLSDLECVLGRDDVGGMYTGVACRLAFDYGLNLEHSQLGLLPAELQSRRRLLRSCILYDKGWSLYLGRPTSIKNSDLDMSQLTDIFSRLGSFGESENFQRPARPDMDVDKVENLVFDAMLELLEIASKVQEKTHSDNLPGTASDENSLVEIAALGSNLNTWSARLPSQLRWTTENAKNATSLFFIMHQQFHTTQALLHGPYGQYGEALQDQYGGPEVNAVDSAHEVHSFVPLARSIAFKHALKVAQIFAHHRARFGKGQFGLFSLTHASTASLVLTANASLNNNMSERKSTLRSVRILLDELTEMALVYQPAKMMVSVMEHYLQNTGMGFSDLPITDPTLTPVSLSSGVFARRSSEHDPDYASQYNRKRRNTDNDWSSILNIPFSIETGGAFPPPSRPNDFTSHAHGDAEGEDFEILHNDSAGIHDHPAKENGWNTLDSASIHNISDNGMEPSLWPGESTQPPLGGSTGAQIPIFAHFSPSFLLNDSSDHDTRHHNFGSNLGDGFLGYHGEGFINASW